MKELEVQVHGSIEMELKKLHMGTMSYGADSMDEVAHQLALAFGLSSEQGNASDLYIYIICLICFASFL